MHNADVNALSGRELKIKVAEALGWKRQSGNDIFWTTPEGEHIQLAFFPDWPTDIAAAWELGIELDLYFAELRDWYGQMFQEKQYYVRANACDGKDIYIGYAPFDSDAEKSAAYATARCRAWLKAIRAKQAEVTE